MRSCSWRSPEPPPLVHLALEGYLGFAETVLDKGCATNASRGAVIQILQDTLVTVVQPARSASEANVDDPEPSRADE